MENESPADEEEVDQKPEYETICEQYSVASALVADKSPAQQLLDTPMLFVEDQADKDEEEVDFAA